MLKTTIAPFVLTLALTPACAVVDAASPDEPEPSGTATSALVADATLLLRRPDGRFDVRCSSGAVELVTEQQIFADDVCRVAGPTVCAPRCSSRWPNGTCRTFAADFCGAGGASCAAYCAARWLDGSCRSYGPDVCAASPITCAAKCAGRWPTGACRGYDADSCAAGATATCVATCVARGPTGDCRDYGADTCAAGPVACTPRCASRWPSGACRAYAPDACGTTAPTCVVPCAGRWPDGTCRAYGADFCGGSRPVGAALGAVVSMARRAPGVFEVLCIDGSTSFVGAQAVRAGDLCDVLGAPSCVPRCTARLADGTCNAYGADFCAEGRVVCAPRCSARWPNGTCRAYGPDVCSRLPPA